MRGHIILHCSSHAALRFVELDRLFSPTGWLFVAGRSGESSSATGGLRAHSAPDHDVVNVPFVIAHTSSPSSCVKIEGERVVAYQCVVAGPPPNPGYLRSRPSA